MNFRQFNIKNKNLKDPQYLSVALSTFSSEECLLDMTFVSRLFNVVTYIGRLKLNEENFDYIRAKEGNDALVYDLYNHMRKKLHLFKTSGNINSWIGSVAHNFFIDLSKKDCKFLNLAGDHYFFENQYEKDQEELIDMVRKYINSFEDDKKHSKELKQDLCTGEMSFEEISSKYNIPISTLKHYKKKLVEEAKTYFKNELG